MDTVNKIMSNNRIHSSHGNIIKNPVDVLDKLKPKLALKSLRLARYKKALQRKNGNILLHTKEKIFYRTFILIQKKNRQSTGRQKTPAVHELEEFLAGIWGTEAQHNRETQWIIEEERRWKDIDEMQFNEISESEIQAITGYITGNHQE